MREVKRSLQILWIIFKNEIKLFFVSPLVYLIGAVWLFLAGGFFSLSLSAINQGMSEPSMVFMLQWMLFLLIFIAPALTMRLVSEEVRTGTHELLFTAPVRDWEIIFAKWLAVWAVFTLYVLITATFPLILILRGNPEIGLIITGYLAMWLLGGTMLAIGIFASSLTQYQLVAFMITLGILLGLSLAQAATNIITNPAINSVLGELSMIGHYRSMIDRALIDPVDVAYFVGLIATSLFLATQALSTRRWSA